MPRIDTSKQFVLLKIAVLTVSDTRDLADDKSGATLVERIEKAGRSRQTPRGTVQVYRPALGLEGPPRTAVIVTEEQGKVRASACAGLCRTGAPSCRAAAERGGFELIWIEVLIAHLGNRRKHRRHSYPSSLHSQKIAIRRSV